MAESSVVRAEGASVRIGRIRGVLFAVLLLNIAVAVAKLVWGIVSGSAAMQADGFHSLFDGASNVVGLVGVAFASRPADTTHPYGHTKYEAYASAAIAGMLVFAAYRVASSSIAKLSGTEPEARIDFVAFAVMIGTLVVNLGVTVLERRAGQRLGSQILMADASHTGSDVLVSLGVIVSLVLVKYFDLPMADPVVALVVALMIVRTAWEIFKEASDTLADSARIPEADVCAVAREAPGVLGCHGVRTRGALTEVYADLHILVDPRNSVAEGHAIAEAVERRLLERMPQIADAVVHVEPLGEHDEAG
ncbi:MAG: cation diffusion facilitator family transporter [Coriobacteriia bacterium]